MFEQVTRTVVTSTFDVPLAPVTAQFCVGFEGWVSTETLKPAVLATAVPKVNAVALALTGKLSLLLSCSTSPVPTRPVIEPPTVYVAVVQATLTLVTFPFTVPLPPVTTQLCVGLVG
jgi:hypothetical protein